MLVYKAKKASCDSQNNAIICHCHTLSPLVSPSPLDAFGCLRWDPVLFWPLDEGLGWLKADKRPGRDKLSYDQLKLHPELIHPGYCRIARAASPFFYRMFNPMFTLEKIGMLKRPCQSVD